MSIDFTDQVVIVTGAGNGLGRSHALLFGSRGAKVVVNDLGGSIDGSGGSSSAADAVVAEIQAAGGEAVANYDSVATQESARSIVATAIDTWGRVDAVVNNAGILRDKSLLKMEPADLDLVLDVHLKGTIYVSQAAFPHMKEAGYGRFVHTSSQSGLFGNFGQTNYAAAKAGIYGAARVIAEEGAKYNILSNVIAPVARTRMTEELLGPLAEKVTPEHVSPMVAYLCSRDCTITHQVFSAAGGRYARVFVGLTEGWYAGGGTAASPEDIAAHLETIMAEPGYTVPTKSLDEIMLLAKVLAD